MNDPHASESHEPNPNNPSDPPPPASMQPPRDDHAQDAAPCGNCGHARAFHGPAYEGREPQYVCREDACACAEFRAAPPSIPPPSAPPQRARTYPEAVRALIEEIVMRSEVCGPIPTAARLSAERARLRAIPAALEERDLRLAELRAVLRRLVGALREVEKAQARDVVAVLDDVLHEFLEELQNSGAAAPITPLTSAVFKAAAHARDALHQVGRAEAPEALALAARYMHARPIEADAAPEQERTEALRAEIMSAERSEALRAEIVSALHDAARRLSRIKGE